MTFPKIGERPQFPFQGGLNILIQIIWEKNVQAFNNE